eukprot:5894984-Pleurochrysis_carterae.AAC.1
MLPLLGGGAMVAAPDVVQHLLPLAAAAAAHTHAVTQMPTHTLNLAPAPGHAHAQPHANALAHTHAHAHAHTQSNTRATAHTQLRRASLALYALQNLTADSRIDPPTALVGCLRAATAVPTLADTAFAALAN